MKAICKNRIIMIVIIDKLIRKCKSTYTFQSKNDKEMRKNYIIYSFVHSTAHVRKIIFKEKSFTQQ